MQDRHYNLMDQLILGLDRALGQMVPEQTSTGRSVPAAENAEDSLTEQEKKHVAGLMRVNHAGEVAAQGLYHGQACVARQASTRESLLQSAREEGDHLTWCAERLQSLNSHTSYLNPIWYVGSFTLGTVAGLFGDKWSLGFIVETEYQVEAHLDEHLQLLPEQDSQSRAILEQIKQDEAHHAATALSAGGEPLPTAIKRAMTLCSKIMTKSAYHI